LPVKCRMLLLPTAHTSLVPLPKTSFLNAVHGSGTKDVWAVGKSNILHFTGKP